jgi:predicted NBD/HSP70 family sugar kinase
MALKGTNQEFGRPYNRRIVLETIRLHGPIARGQIAARVGLTVQTVSTIIRELEVLGLVAGARGQSRGRGYPATSLTLNPAGGYAIGVNVTPRGIEAGLVNLDGEVVASATVRKPQLSPRRAMTELKALVRKFRAAHPAKRLLGIGLAMPGPFDVESMSFVGPTTLESWKGFPVLEQLKVISGLPAFIEVDHAAAALGERLHGVGKGFGDFYFLYFGVGLGGCMVHEGLPIRGAFRNAGEIGHISVVPRGEACPCGNRGCLERYLSVEAFERRSAEGGPAAWLREAAPLLRQAIVMIENLFDPETIVVGGIAEAEMLDPLLASLEPLPNSIAQRGSRKAPRVLRSEGGPDAVLRGAAALAIAGVLSPRFGTMFAHGEDRSAGNRLLKPVEAA